MATVLWCYIPLRIFLFPVIPFPRRHKNDYGFGIQVQLVSMYIFAFWTDAVSFSALLVETPCQIAHGILYQFVNTWTHWVLIRLTAGVPSLLALYQLQFSLSICSLFLRRSFYFRESILNENRQSIPPIAKPTRCTRFSNYLFLQNTLHVSDGLSVRNMYSVLQE
jgi:hypothetical protein